ncbi:hypothetical protein ACFSMW_18550 [Virgibacillus halophilus]|uniref:Uncharacterized protein n=1 Tax=Tigheibacillus halophilus TaxID=361280 RepID=A0ABU5C8A3_9BACI|nr:hypothetical protein [Virgibacillus halophilus]
MNEKLTGKSKRLEAILWSIAFPGFGQFLNKKYIKGIVFIALEFMINVKGHLNQVIIYGFHGQTHQSMTEANYLWLMFYPCVYFFAIWDAYRDAGGGEKPFAYLPFVSGAYWMTLGVVFSTTFSFGDVFIGPVWLAIIFVPIGLFFGILTRWIILRFSEN